MAEGVVGDAAVGDTELVQAGLLPLQLGAVRSAEADVVEARAPLVEPVGAIGGGVGVQRQDHAAGQALDADSQSRNLRVTLSHLLRVIEPQRSERDASFLIRAHGVGLKLIGGEWFDADLWRFDRLWEAASQADKQGVPSIALDAMRQAVELWRDDPSELAANDWALAEVEERRVRMVSMAARAGELLLARDDPDAARLMGEAALRCDPWCEQAHHVVVAAHLAAGHHRHARNALKRYDEVLTELGIDPGARARRIAPLAHGSPLASYG